jgi:hypothetical protein
VKEVGRHKDRFLTCHLLSAHQLRGSRQTGAGGSSARSRAKRVECHVSRAAFSTEGAAGLGRAKGLFTPGLQAGRRRMKPDTSPALLALGGPACEMC